MSLVLVKETGLGLSTANSYATAADGDSYHEGHAYPSGWTSKTTAQKEAALVMATRVIDAYVQFGGRKTTDGQALQWPRCGCPNPDAPGGGLVLRFLGSVSARCWDSTVIPPMLVAATCEQARCLLGNDLTGPPEGEGKKSMHVGDVVMVYDVLRPPGVLSRVTAALLAKLGVVMKDGGSFCLTLARG